MNITRVGNSIIPIITHNLVLNNVVHVPSSHKNKLVFSAIKIFFAQWHMHLGHPSRDIVRRVILKNNLPCSHFGSSKDSVCDACACAKAHQLPYSFSSSHSSTPLELIYSDVWGPVIDSFGHKKYYISFIDDYSKFNWIYLLRHKSEVSKYFFEFQKLVEHMLDRKIITVQSDWGGEYEKLNTFFTLLVFLTMSLVHTRTSKMGLLSANTATLWRWPCPSYSCFHAIEILG
jgi:hypothetical protein